MASVKFKRGLQVDVPNDDPDSLIVTQPTDNTDYDSIFLGDNQIGTTHVYAGDSETIQGLDYYRPGLVPSGDGSGNKYLSGAGTWVSTSSFSNAESITYASLKTLRDGGNLNPGQLYRITDYVTTTAQTYTQSAGHQFDVIVVADSTNKLNETAFAAHHAGESYFTNCKLESWELKYCLDNDANSFAWADSSTGKGVIYYMKDEFGNECPYDFKNIQFKRNLLAVDANNKPVLTNLADWYGSDWMNEESYIPACNTAYDDFKNSTTHSLFWSLGTAGVIEVGGGWYDDLDNYLKQEAGYQDGDMYIILSENDNVGPQLVAKVTSTECYFYTFTSESGITSNHSISQDSITDNSLSASNGVYNNKFESTLGGTWNLHNNILFGSNCHSNTFGNSCYSNTFGNSCYNNTFGNNYQYNTFGNNCNYNTFRNSCYNNTFGNSCGGNTFGNSCGGNTFGNSCNYNTFGNNCNYNAFGNNCYSNTFGNSCNYNTFGNNYQYNTFGNNCNYNAFGNNCYSNTFGNSCNYNTFGNNCSDNTFGNNCSDNTFGNNCSDNTFGDGCFIIQFSKDYTYYCIVENGNQYITLTSTQPTSSSNLLRNITIAQGTNNTSTTKTISHNTVNDTFKTTYQPANSQVISV